MSVYIVNELKGCLKRSVVNQISETWIHGYLQAFLASIGFKKHVPVVEWEFKGAIVDVIWFEEDLTKVAALFEVQKESKIEAEKKIKTMHEISKRKAPAPISVLWLICFSKSEVNSLRALSKEYFNPTLLIYTPPENMNIKERPYNFNRLYWWLYEDYKERDRGIFKL